MSFKEQSYQKLPPHFSRILIELHSYVQKLNLNRIIDGLQAENMFSLPVHQGLKRMDDIYEKSDIMVEILNHKEEKDFIIFLKIVASETVGKFYDATKQFFSLFTNFPGYENYALWPNVKLSTLGTAQIGGEVFTIGRDGGVNYDPVHGSMLHVAKDSLPDGIDEVTVTRRHRLNPCKLHYSMQSCSAIVYFEIEPLIEFTKDIHVEIPHSFASIDTQELCFVKYDHFMEYTGFGEIHSGGLFPAGYPYGVIATRTFSAYSISTKKQWRAKGLGRKARVHQLQSHLLQNKFKSLSISKKRQPSNHMHDGVNIPNGYWLGVVESTDKRTVSFLLSQCTPTGYKTLQQVKEGCICVLSKLHFQSDKLTFHPQTAEDCNWKIFVADQKYQISKAEVDNYAQVTYHLVLTKLHSSISTDLCIPVTLTGGDNKFIHVISEANPDATVSIVDDELLHKLYAISVKPSAFMQQLACKLPFWQPVARLLGLNEVDITEIEADYPIGQREDGSFLPVFKGEQAYQALLKWMQTKGQDATYGELLVALYNALLSNDNITDAWWYAYNELTGSKLFV